MVAPSCGRGCCGCCGCGIAGIVTSTSTPDMARAAANLPLTRYSVGLDVMGTRILNGFDRTRRYSFVLSVVVFGDVPGGGGAPLGVGPAPSLSKSLVACAATCAMFNVMSCFWPPRSMVTVTWSEVWMVLKT